MANFPLQLQKELDNLIDIACHYRDGNISQSLLLDIVSKFKNDKSSIDEYKEYLLNHNVRVVSGEEDFETEDYDNDEAMTIKPYDTKLIDISPKPLSLDMIIARLANDEIDLMPGFQRKSGLWSEEQKSQLIESLILRIPLPAFYFDGSINDMWVVIDGLQRLTALKEFFVDKTLALKGLEFLKDLEGLTVDNMPRVYERRMKETQIITYIINPGAPINLKYNIFKRINTGGLQLEPQEIRHALFQGFATEYLERLANMKRFKEVTGYSIKSDRMMDREFALRFIAFYELSIDDYKGSIDIFLNNAMEYINKNYTKIYADEVERLFEKALDVSDMIFGKFAFRRMPDTDKRRPISKALFETWTSILARYSYEELQILIERKKLLIEKYVYMCLEDKDFLESIRSGKVSAIRKRYEKIENLVKGTLEQ